MRNSYHFYLHSPSDNVSPSFRHSIFLLISSSSPLFSSLLSHLIFSHPIPSHPIPSHPIPSHYFLLPLGWHNTLAIRATWLTASWKKTNSILDGYVTLYSSKYSKRRSLTLFLSFSSLYFFWVRVRKSPYNKEMKSFLTHFLQSNEECNCNSVALSNQFLSSSLTKRSLNTLAPSWHHRRTKESLSFKYLGLAISIPWKTFDRSLRLKV